MSYHDIITQLLSDCSLIVETCGESLLDCAGEASSTVPVRSILSHQLQYSLRTWDSGIHIQ